MFFESTRSPTSISSIEARPDSVHTGVPAAKQLIGPMYIRRGSDRPTVCVSEMLTSILPPGRSVSVYCDHQLHHGLGSDVGGRSETAARRPPMRPFSSAVRLLYSSTVRC